MYYLTVKVTVVSSFSSFIVLCIMPVTRAMGSPAAEKLNVLISHPNNPLI